MIIEIVGPPGIGKSYYGNKAAEANNYIYSDEELRSQLSKIKLFFLFIKSSYTLLRNFHLFGGNQGAQSNYLLWKKNMNYLKSILNKLILYQLMINNEDVYIPDEGLLSIDLSIQTFFDEKVVKNYRIFNNKMYRVVLLKLDTEENIKRLKERPWPPTWEMFEIGPDLEGLVETYRINLSSLITHLESNGTSVAEVVLSGDSKDEELVSKVIVQSMES